MERTKVAKHVELVSRKAAIVFDVPPYRKPTQVDERRENPKAGGRSIVKELGKMTP